MAPGQTVYSRALCYACGSSTTWSTGWRVHTPSSANPTRAVLPVPAGCVPERKTLMLHPAEEYTALRAAV